MPPRTAELALYRTRGQLPGQGQDEESVLDCARRLHIGISSVCGGVARTRVTARAASDNPSRRATVRANSSDWL